jgi:TRAP-type mannitol/chloroaromatic compound transport system permease small subunit
MHLDALLALSRSIDALTERIGRAVTWLVLAAVLISAANAIVRKAFNMSSNAFLEIQWYLFSAVFLLCAAWTLQRNEHVRIDVIAGRLSRRAQLWIDILGTLFFLFPMAGLILWLSIPWFLQSFNNGEHSPSAGGLILWPAKLLVPVGFTLLLLQGCSELVKRIAVLRGVIPDPATQEHELSAEEQLAQEILKARGEQV